MDSCTGDTNHDRPLVTYCSTIYVLFGFVPLCPRNAVPIRRALSCAPALKNAVGSCATNAPLHRVVCLVVDLTARNGSALPARAERFAMAVVVGVEFSTTASPSATSLATGQLVGVSRRSADLVSTTTRRTATPRQQKALLPQPSVLEYAVSTDRASYCMIWLEREDSSTSADKERISKGSKH